MTSQNSRWGHEKNSLFKNKRPLKDVWIWIKKVKSSPELHCYTIILDQTWSRRQLDKISSAFLVWSGRFSAGFPYFEIKTVKKWVWKILKFCAFLIPPIRKIFNPDIATSIVWDLVNMAYFLLRLCYNLSIRTRKYNSRILFL